MTKYSMVKKFCKETGCDKKAARDHLRRCRWDYNSALTVWAFKEIDWELIGKRLAEVMEAVTETLRKIVEGLPKILEDIASSYQEACERLGEIDEVKKE